MRRCIAWISKPEFCRQSGCLSVDKQSPKTKTILISQVNSWMVNNVITSMNVCGAYLIPKLEGQCLKKGSMCFKQRRVIHINVLKQNFKSFSFSFCK